MGVRMTDKGPFLLNTNSDLRYFNANFFRLRCNKGSIAGRQTCPKETNAEKQLYVILFCNFFVQ